MRQAVAKAQPKQQKPQQTVVRKAERAGGGGEDGSGRVLMTIELELTRKNGEEGPSGEGGTAKSEPLGLFSRLANQLAFK